MRSSRSISPRSQTTCRRCWSGLQPTVVSNSLWQKLVTAIDRRLLTSRQVASLTAFRDLMVALSEMARRESVSMALGKVLDQSGYLRDLREDRSEEAEGRIENLMELVSAAREYETREPEPSLGGFVDRLSLLSDVDKEEGTRESRVLLMTLHSAKGLEFPGGRHGRHGGRVCSRTRARRRTKRSSRKSGASATSASREPVRGWCSPAPRAGESSATIRAPSPRAFSRRCRRT